VFSDAATHVFNGESPYKRHTYRYTPLAAYMVLVNNYIHPVCGKLVFCLCDCFMTLILWRIFEAINPRKESTYLYVAFCTFNPLTVNLSTRGSNDNIISLLVFISIYYLLKRQYVLSGIFYGLSVHFKIYPIIYAAALYLFIDADFKLIRAGRKWDAFKASLFSRNKLVFTVVSAGTFLGLTYYFYTVYGYEFLYETYLYHFERKDHRHNFSIYFYMIYQVFDDPSSTTLAIASFLPQWGIVIIASLFLYYDLFLCLFVQTTAFVMFNKVITA
jgi:phosphatidylinositol glycan class M